MTNEVHLLQLDGNTLYAEYDAQAMPLGCERPKGDEKPRIAAIDSGLRG
ncbi:MAG: hypothetical protein NUK54_10490 [Methanothrix sp.]|nr:hypothetical protein [Methanothrix sp.]